MSTSLKNQVALVVGASSGIGRSTALLLARQGAKVMASARRQDRLAALKAEAATEGNAIETHTADAKNPADLDRLAEATRQALGPIDIMVFATGTNTPERSMKKLRPEVWRDLLETNLDGAFYAAQAVLPEMRERRSGHMVFISSISGHTPDVSGAAYQASKRGLIGLAHAIRLEEKENGIRTTVINPGLVDTEILAKRPVQPTAEQLAAALLPEHVAEAVLSCVLMPARAVITELTLMPSAM